MRAMIIAMILSLSAETVLAKPHLRDVPEIDGAILTLKIADKIRKKCPDISARMWRAVMLANGLPAKARKLGYSESEIEAYQNSDVELDRIRVVRDKYLAAAGVQKDSPETYCKVGRAEINKGSQIGALLRMN